jgi:trimethylamine:corrinoid methyltransferase-like protein
MLETYNAPDIDLSIDEALRAFIEQRKEALPDSDY